MAMIEQFSVRTEWTGNRGTGTSNYRAYGREHVISAAGKSAEIPGASAPVFRGDAARYNPEELLVAAASACHMLSFLHVCADAGIAVTAYHDEASCTVRVHRDGSGEVERIVLHPVVELTDETRRPELDALHHRAHELCFIARSLACPVEFEL